MKCCRWVVTLDIGLWYLRWVRTSNTGEDIFSQFILIRFQWRLSSFVSGVRINDALWMNLTVKENYEWIVWHLTWNWEISRHDISTFQPVSRSLLYLDSWIQYFMLSKINVFFLFYRQQLAALAELMKLFHENFTATYKINNIIIDSRLSCNSYYYDWHEIHFSLSLALALQQHSAFWIFKIQFLCHFTAVCLPTLTFERNRDQS